MKRRLLSNRGVTMIEIMITLVIIGITASMAVPRFQAAVDKMNFRSANRDVVSSLRMARSRAISEKKGYGLFFDDANATITFYEKVGSDPTTFESGTDVLISVDTFQLNSGDYFDMLWTEELTSPYIVFSSNGSASSGGNLWTICLTDELTGVARIEILAATGRISTDTYTW